MTLIEQISQKFNGANVDLIIIDSKVGNIRAKINGQPRTACGNIHEYCLTGEALPSYADVFMPNQLDGKWCRVTGIFPDPGSVNSFMLSDDGQDSALLAEVSGVSITARVNDLGMTPESS